MHELEKRVGIPTFCMKRIYLFYAFLSLFFAVYLTIPKVPPINLHDSIFFGRGRTLGRGARWGREELSP